MGEKVSVRNIKKARGIICHTILYAQVLKNRRVEEKLP